MGDNNISLLEFEGNPNIGLFMFANDKFCLCGKELKPEIKKKVESVLGVPVYKVSILSTELPGIFLTGNNDFVLVPEIFEYEREELAKILEKHKVEYIKIDDKLNTFGNNILVGDKKILLNKAYSAPFKKKLAKLTGYEVIDFNNKALPNIGSLARFVKGNYFISQELTEEDLPEIVEEVKGAGSVNAGLAYISSGVVCNKNGVLLGSMCSTVEIQNVIESLDYL